MNGVILLKSIPFDSIKGNESLRSKLIIGAAKVEPLKVGASHIACVFDKEHRLTSKGEVVIARVYIDPHDNTDEASKALLQEIDKVISEVFRSRSHCLSLATGEGKVVSLKPQGNENNNSSKKPEERDWGYDQRGYVETY